MTFLQFFRYYIGNYASLHCKRWRYFELYLLRWSDRELTSIRRQDVMELQAELLRTRNKGAANHAIELVSMLYSKAVEWDMFEGKNPADNIRKFQFKARDRFLQPDELPRFLEAVAKQSNRTVRDFLLMLLYTGQRRRNVASMRWEEVDFHRQIWCIPDTKNGTPHTVPLVPEAMHLLIDRVGVHDTYVFPKQDGSGPLWQCWRIQYNVMKDAGISNLRMHDLRRTLASWQVATGASLPIVGRTLNHKDPKSTAIYARLHLEPVREAMERAVTAMTTVAAETTNEQPTDKREIDTLPCSDRFDATPGFPSAGTKRDHRSATRRSAALLRPIR